MEKRRLRISVDVGGNFTDATLRDPVGPRVSAVKALATPADRAIGLIEVIRIDPHRGPIVHAGHSDPAAARARVTTGRHGRP